jgi:TonB-dependent receptor
MENKPFSLMKTGVLLLTLLATTVAAWSQTGSIAGRVLDQMSGRYLQSANVRIAELNRTTDTNITGDFVFRNIPAGSYTISANYIGVGFSEVTLEVTAGEVATIVVVLGSDKIIDLEEFVTSGIQTGSQRALNQQRAASGVKMVISEEQFGQMNDGNIGLALEKMPGLSVDGDAFSEIPRYVNIRGIDAQYNNVQLDGNRMPSSGTGAPGSIGDGGAYGDTANGFALDDAPADAISNVEVIKAPLPEHDGDSLGGIVNLITRSAFERSGSFTAYNAGISYSGLRDSYSPTFSLSYSDILGEEGQFGISASVSYYKRDEGFDNTDYDWNPLHWTTNVNDNDIILNDYLATQLEAGRQEAGFPEGVYMYHEDEEYNNFGIESDRYSASFNFDWRVNDRTELYLRTAITKEERTYDDIRHHLIMDNDHGSSADPLEQYVSLYRFDDARYYAGNYFDFVDFAEANGVEDQEFTAGEVYTFGGQSMVFDPGHLQRLGRDPDHISTLNTITGFTTTTTWHPDGTGRGRSAYEGEWQDQTLDFYNISLGGKTELTFGVIDYNVFFAKNQKEVIESDTEFRRQGFQWTYNRVDPFRIVWTNLDPYDRFGIPNQSDPDRFRLGFFELNDRTTEEDYIGFETNLTIEFPDTLEFTGRFKTGIKAQFEERSYDWDERQFSARSAFPYADFLRDNPYDPIVGNDNFRIPYTPDVRRMRSVATNEDYFSFRDPQSLEDSFEQDYDASRDTYAGYLQATVEFGGLEIVAGARIERIEFESSQFVRPEGNFEYITTMGRALNANFDGESDIQWLNEDTGQTQTLARDSSSSETTEILPSVHFKYEISDNMLARLSWGKTYGRANFSDLVGITDVDDTDDPIGISRGNPNLPNLHSENFDLTLEYYSDFGGYFSLGIFHKEVENFSYSATQTGTAEDLGVTDLVGDPNANVEISTAEAALGAINKGFEFVAGQELLFIPEEFGKFTANFNATYTDTDAKYPGRTEQLPTRGASEELYHAALDYEIGKLRAGVSFNYRSAYIEGLAFVDQQGTEEGDFAFTEDDVFDDYQWVSANIEYRINDYFTVYLNGTNLFNDWRKSLQGRFGGIKTTADDVYWNERRVNFGIKGSF